jgi:sporulation protein YlmC with PRC-barrel domain
VELIGERGAVSDLIGLRVRNRSGRSLGRVYEIRAHWERDGTVVVDELLLGGRGLWRRLRGPAVEDRGIPWASVIELDQAGDLIAAAE